MSEAPYQQQPYNPHQTDVQHTFPTQTYQQTQSYPESQQQSYSGPNQTGQASTSQQPSTQQYNTADSQRRRIPIKDRFVNIVDRLVAMFEKKLDIWERGTNGTTPR